MKRFARFAWSLLAYDVLVAAWGAYVRATGSGAGCGRHWPLCNGEVAPIGARTQTLIEFSHRVSAGVGLALTAALLVWALVALPPRHPARAGAALATFFMGAEAIIGAALVLFELVARDASAKRALSVSLHLVNTFFLLASMAMTARWASGGAPVRLRGQGAALWAVGVPLVAMILVGATGALAALGDTLFPAASLAAGIAQDRAPNAHLLLRLRGLHPFVAAATAVIVLASAPVVRALRPDPGVRLLSRTAVVLVVAQVCLGLADLASLAPVALQLGHLVLADATWIALVCTAAAALGAPRAESPLGASSVSPIRTG